MKIKVDNKSKVYDIKVEMDADDAFENSRIDRIEARERHFDSFAPEYTRSEVTYHDDL